MSQLKEQLGKQGLDTKGLKKVLVDRLTAAVDAEKIELGQQKLREVESRKEAAASKRKAEEAASNNNKKPKVDEEEEEEEEASSSDDSDEGDSSDDEGDSDDSSDDDEVAVKIKFRNYNPTDKKLRALRLKKVIRQDHNWLLEELKETLACAVKPQDMNVSVAPKKQNWDLKRDLKPRLEILSKKTERAVLELMRAKAEEQEAEEDSSSSDSDSSSSDDEDDGKKGDKKKDSDSSSSSDSD